MLVELKNIHKQYTNPASTIKNMVLNDISFSLEKGESMSITGPSGSGKSTLLNILGTLDLPDSGTYMLNGTDVKQFSDKRLAEIRNRHIGFIFQMHHLLPQLSLLENVLLPVLPQKNKQKQKNAAQRAMHLLEKLQLADKIHQRPGQLSGGECQRATVVRALINEPQLILADEPTGSLDQDSALQMGELLADINKQYQVAMIVVTHSPELAKQMNRVYKLVQGKLLNN